MCVCVCVQCEEKASKIMNNIALLSMQLKSFCNAELHTHKHEHFLLSVYLSRSFLYKVFVYGFVRVPQSVVKFDFIFNFQPRIERSFRRLYERSRTNGPTTVVQAALSSGHIQIL